jgi:hypothetical protein
LYLGKYGILGTSIPSKKKNTEALVVASKETGLEVNVKTTNEVHGPASR